MYLTGFTANDMGAGQRARGHPRRRRPGPVPGPHTPDRLQPDAQPAGGSVMSSSLPPRAGTDHRHRDARAAAGPAAAGHPPQHPRAVSAAGSGWRSSSCPSTTWSSRACAPGQASSPTTRWRLPTARRSTTTAWSSRTTSSATSSTASSSRSATVALTGAGRRFMAAFAIVRGTRPAAADRSSRSSCWAWRSRVQATIVPIFYMITKIHLYDTPGALILPSIAFAIPITVHHPGELPAGRAQGAVRVDAPRRRQRLADAVAARAAAGPPAVITVGHLRRASTSGTGSCSR